LLVYRVIRGLQSQRPTLGVVRIAGDEVHEALRDPAQRIFLRARTEGSGQGAGGDLHKATEPRPFCHALRLAAENGVALGVGDYGPQTLDLQGVQGVVHGGWDGDFVELDEQVIALVDAETRGVSPQSLEIFRVEMKVASGSQLQPVTDFGLQAFAQALNARIIERIIVAAMWRGDDMGNAVGDCRFGHSQ